MRVLLLSRQDFWRQSFKVSIENFLGAYIGSETRKNIVLIDSMDQKVSSIRNWVHQYSNKMVFIVTAKSRRNIFVAMEGVNGVFCHECSVYQILQTIATIAAPKDGQAEKKISIQSRLVLASLKQGKSNKEIAREYDIPLSRVKYHLRNIYQYLGASNRAQATLLAQQSGL